MTSQITRERIAETAARIRPHVRRTPTVDIDGAELGLDGVAVTLKLESLQHAGSFKTRGAFANLVGREVPPAGVAAASGGNHGAAVAYAAMRLGVPARIYVPDVSSPAKVERIRGYGADLVIGGERYADALAACERWAADSGALTVHAFDDEGTLLGQGTLGMELQAQAPSLDTVLLGVGGGGLAAGVAAWYDGAARGVGVEPERAPTLERALAAGRPVDVDVGGVAVDSLGARRVGERVFPVARRRSRRCSLDATCRAPASASASW